MPNSIGVLDQLTPTTARPRLFVKRKEAIFLLSTGQTVWVEQEKLMRKTPKYKRLTADTVIHKQSEGKLFQWKPLQSGFDGPTVMQLV